MIMLGFIMSMLITWYRRIGGAVHFYGLINPLEHERSHWVRNRASSSHISTTINLPEMS